MWLARDTWTESKHPRGQPKNPGQFAHSVQLAISKLKKIGGQLGSNPGGRYLDTNGKEYYIKKGKSPEHVRNEYLAGKLYNATGAKTLTYRPVEGGGHIATEFGKLEKDNAHNFSESEKRAAQLDFATHAWLANWDAVGLGGDNLGILGGQPTNLDLGGALSFRAQGSPKGSAFGNKVGEWNTLRDKNVNRDTYKVFGDITPERLKESAQRVVSVSDKTIVDAVAEHNLDKSLADKLIARRDHIAALAGLSKDIASDNIFTSLLERSRKATDSLLAVDSLTAAGILFITPDHRALFLKRSDLGDHKGEWCLPGGGVLANETPEVAARRETVEETGKLPKWELTLLDKNTTNGVEYSTFSQLIEEEFKPELNEEHSHYVWASLAHPPSPLHPGLKALIQSGSMAADQSIDGIEIDRSCDVPEMSCMSKDGKKMYVDRSLPLKITNNGKTLDPAQPLLRHELPEWKAMKEAIDKLDKPSDEDRKQLYLHAHYKVANPSERHWIIDNGYSYKEWEDWCDEQLRRLEHEKVSKAVPDPDVKPLPHRTYPLNLMAALDEVLPFALDRASVREYDIDGRLHVDITNISKACINPYWGSEIPNHKKLGLDPNKQYRLLRDPGELAKAAKTFEGLPILRKHIPVSAVDHQPWDVIGATGTDAVFVAPYLRNSLVIWPKGDIEDIISEEKKELSCGYRYDPDMTPGVYEGEAYDGVMRNIIGNHVALVKEGRAGPDVSVNY